MIPSACILGYCPQSQSYHSAYPAPNLNNESLGSSSRIRSSLSFLKSTQLVSSSACLPAPHAGGALALATSGFGWAQTMLYGAIVMSEANACLCNLKAQISAPTR